MMRGSVRKSAAVGEIASPDLFPGEDGRQYRASDELGRGVLTAVYRAECMIATPGSLVLKTVLPLWIGHPLAEARIAREREVSAAIHDPARVAASDAPLCARISAAGRQPCEGGRSRPFHVSARLSGSTLAERLRADPARQETAPPVGQGLAWIDDLLHALERVHAVGWVHRDVKPHNVFLRNDPGAVGNPRAWLIDFGLALPVGAPRRDQEEAFGTPAYVSPEVIAGAPVDPRADLYSVGLLLFELCTGQRPFAGRDPVALLDAHLSEPPPRLRSLRPTSSAELDRVVAATLGKDPAERPASAHELRALLRQTPEAATQ